MTSLPTMLRMLLALVMATALLSGSAGARGLKDYQHIVWTEQNGAPADIAAFAQTTDGWLWIGSSDGLFRFDGVNFEPYPPAGHPELAHMRVVELHAADNGDLYISYFPTALAVLRRDGSFALLPAPAEFQPISARAMVVDRDDSLWTIGHGIRRYANGRWTTVESGIPWISDNFYSMLLDPEGRLWAAARTGVWRLDRQRGRFDKMSDRYGGLAISPVGDVWLIGRDNAPSMRLAKSADGKTRPAHAGAPVASYAGQFAADGTLWVLGCPDTACLIHDVARHGADVRPERDADERVASAQGAAGQENLAILQDREGNIWVLAQNGLNQFRPKRFLVPTPNLDLADNLYSVAADGVGQLWIAERWSGKLWRMGSDGLPVVEPGAPVQLLASGRDGALLKANARQITRMLGTKVETITLPPMPEGTPANHLLFGLLDDGKRIWTAAEGIGAIAWSDGKWQTSAEVGLPKRIYLSQAAGPGQLWLALSTGELVFFDDGKLTRYDASPIGTATGIFPGPQLVVGGSEGLAVLKDGKLQLLRSAEPNSLRGVSGIAVTANGDRWLNGVDGVVHVRASDWQRALERPAQLLRYQLFGVNDGYPGRASIISRSPTAISPDGRHIWFIGSRGIVGLDSGALRRNTWAPHPAVLEVSTDQTRIDVGHALRLPPGSQDFLMRFTAPALRQPERSRFEFRLDGFDAGWRDAGNRRTTSYTNVSPGDYVFRVRAFNEDGIESKDNAVVRMTIEPTLVQSLPFRLALAAAILALLAMLYRLRVRYLTRRITERVNIKTAERERIARTLHDSFLQNVYLLLMRVRKVATRLPEHDSTRQELQLVLNEARHVIDEGRDQVHELRASGSRTLDDIVHDCARSLRALHPEVDFALRRTGPISGAAPGWNQAVVDEAGAIVGEALRNAFTHARARHIVATIDDGGHELLITVHDDGAGIAAEVVDAGRREGHWGLVGMRERAERIQAGLDIQSSAAAGTTVRLRVPSARSDARRAP